MQSVPQENLQTGLTYKNFQRDLDFNSLKLIHGESGPDVVTRPSSIVLFNDTLLI